MSSFCKCKSYSHFFSKNISLYAIFYEQSFNDTLTNDVVSFEQLGPDIFLISSRTYMVCVVIRSASPKGSNSFLLRVDPFSEGRQNNFEIVTSPEKVSVPLYTIEQ